MHVACFAAVLFAGAFALHWLWWRIQVPRRQSAALLGLFTIVLVAGLAAAQFSSSLQSYGLGGFWPALQVAIFHVSLTLAYIVAYSALEERSPSMTLLVHVADSGGSGRTRDELFAVLGAMPPIDLRLSAMTRDKMIVADAEAYRITAKGRAWATTFGTWRRFIRLNKGG